MKKSAIVVFRTQQQFNSTIAAPVVAVAPPTTTVAVPAQVDPKYAPPR